MRTLIVHIQVKMIWKHKMSIRFHLQFGLGLSSVLRLVRGSYSCFSVALAHVVYLLHGGLAPLFS